MGTIPDNSKATGKISVELIDHMGDDLRVANAARVSFQKESELVYEKKTIEVPNGPEPFGWAYDRDGDWPATKTVERTVCLGLSDKDAKLINYLAHHGHWSPFSHCFLTFRIKAPIFVARQLQKHQVGLAWNEVSRRYVDSEPEFYTPEGWRKRAENVKQGSSEETINDIMFEAAYKTRLTDSLATYQLMLRRGVCPEQARMVLPQSMMTEWFWSGSLYAFARVCGLRLDSHAQKETRIVAEGIDKYCAAKFPVSWEALTEPVVIQV
jgi:thymidylate synthase (FAD)